MESEQVTNEGNKTEESSQNDQQKLETTKFFEKPSPNFTESQDTGNEDREGESRGKIDVSGDDDTEKEGKLALKNPDKRESVAQSRREYENQVLSEAIGLLARPVLPVEVEKEEEEKEEKEKEEEDDADDDMSRIATKPKVPNKSISRPSLAHVNSKIPGELSGQPSVKSTKEDVKYWKSREQELLDRIAALESKAATAEAGKEKFQSSADQIPAQRHEKFEEDLSTNAKEKENCKVRLQQIEKELFSKPKEEPKESTFKGVKNPDEIISHLKSQNEDLRGALAKMTAILRDKTALCVSQEKKVAALTNQVESLKEVVAITKDLLNIRNMEVQHISNDISAMESKIDCERQRHNQMLIKMDEAVKLNSELKKEYENQMKLFQHLRDNYEEKIRMISQNSFHGENKDQISDQQRSSTGGGKAIQVLGKTSRGPNYKVNFQDT